MAYLRRRHTILDLMVLSIYIGFAPLFFVFDLSIRSNINCVSSILITYKLIFLHYVYLATAPYIDAKIHPMNQLLRPVVIMDTTIIVMLLPTINDLTIIRMTLMMMNHLMILFLVAVKRSFFKNVSLNRSLSSSSSLE